ncbi:hypothetical protein JW979_03315 [bacterium]|nr:hypothetical protein [candidate division CSSED10-310 bacterium]
MPSITKHVVILVAVIILAGCGGSGTKANIDKVQVGMTQAEVEGVFGNGEETNVPGMVMYHLDKEYSVLATFKDGKLVDKKVITWEK